MDLHDGNHVIETVYDELIARGAIDREDGRRLLPYIEDEWGALTDRERAAVLRRFDS